MVIPNDFLLNIAVIIVSLEIASVKDAEADVWVKFMGIGYTNNELYDLFTYELVEKEDIRLEKLYKATLQQITYGKAYKKSSL